ncbi:hypothetical protein N7450_005516 [Penicillium hetheringtonii]|uniref:NB-ARC domain-containing protein n=1 Tax=Penicillium hetheringtonii TaxID=911720 RepID=A0AAD6GS13_9EURO|nr:hypothetical protein N7450_005516 [Penicillium hetheringtonii]
MVSQSMASNTFGNANSGLQVGISNAPINAQFYLNQERPEIPTSPLSTVPFPRDPDFVDREALVDQIHEKCALSGSWIALVGLGGVGKTQLAMEYSHQVRLRSPETWVFWIHASNADRFEESLRDLAEQVKIPRRDEPKANIFRLVRNWLQNRKMKKWILILDNIDDDWFIHKPITTALDIQTNNSSNTATRPLLEYLPRTSNSSVIVTSRSKEIALKLADHKDLIEVQPMTKTEAIALLEKKLDLPGENEGIVKLAEALEFMPLAIVQAAGYIIHRSPRCSVSQYLEQLRKDDCEATKLLNHEAGYLYRDWEAKNSILLTWQISFDHIRQIRQSAADLLSLMSFFDRQGISENLLRIQKKERKKKNLNQPEEPADISSVWRSNFFSRFARWKKKKSIIEEDADSSSESELDDDFENDIATLRDYSLIYIGEDRTMFTMHRLVQLTARVWLTNQGQIEQWKEQFINNLCQEFPIGEYENWERCRQIFPHVKSAILQRPDSQDSLRQWATLLYKGAWFAWRRGNILDVREMASKSRKERLTIFGGDSKEALDSTIMLAMVYSLEGSWEEAEKLQGQVMETSKTKLGKDHPNTLISMGHLASTYSRQGRWKEAEKLFVQVMETSKSKLGEDHPDTLMSIGSLASTYRNQGRWEEAEKLEIYVMETSKTKLGEDHPNTLSIMANLASTYSMQDRWEEAEKLFVQVVDTSKTKLGEDHPDTLMSIGSLASIYRMRGRWKKAQKLFVQVMETSKTKLGEDHPDTLSIMANLASTYRNQGLWEEAEKLEGQVVKTSKAKLGQDHPNTLISMANLASTYSMQGRWEKAEKLEIYVMETSKTKLGEDHPNTLSSMANLAFTWKTLGRTVDAIDLLRDCLAKQRAIYGPNHPAAMSISETLLKWKGKFNIVASVDNQPSTSTPHPIS